MIRHENNIVHLREHKIEQRNRPNRDGILNVGVDKPDRFPVGGYTSPAALFLIDTFRRIRDKDNYETEVADEEVDGRPLKVLTVYMTFKPTDVPTRLISRSWIDLQRNGHAVRDETYLNGPSAPSSRTDYTLKPFKIGEKEVWMPVAKEQVGYVQVDAEGRPTDTNATEPTVKFSLYIIDGTLRFNTHPGPEVFTSRYKIGVPSSTHLRTLRRDFASNKNVFKMPTKAASNAALQKQLAAVETEHNELVAGPPSDGFAWWGWSVSGLGVVTLASLFALWMQRRGG